MDKLDEVEEQIALLRAMAPTEENTARLQRLYLDRERLHERQFKSSLRRRARGAK